MFLEQGSKRRNFFVKQWSIHLARDSIELRFGMFFPSFEGISESSFTGSLQQKLAWKLVLVVKLKMSKQAGKKQNYPTARKSYTASRAGVGGRKKKKSEGAKDKK